MLKVANSVISASRITGVLPVVNGGTGVTTSTGTGNTVLSATPTLSGDVTLSTGNLVIGTAGKGIDFSATSHPAGMTSELLADYEEGTYTPELGGMSGGAVTYTTQTGRYTKVGRQVTVYFLIVVNTNSNTGGNTFITMPFVPDAGGYVGPLGFNTSSNASITHVSFFSAVSATYFYTAGGGTLDGSAVGAGCQLSGSITYFV